MILLMLGVERWSNYESIFTGSEEEDRRNQEQMRGRINKMIPKIMKVFCLTLEVPEMKINQLFNGYI